MVFLYKTNKFSGELKEFCAEGRNFWMPFSELKNTQLSNSFDISIDVIYLSNKSELYYKQIDNKWEKFTF